MAIATPAEAAGSGWYVSLTGGANWTDDDSFIVGPFGSSFFALNTEADTGYVVAGAVGLSLGNIWNGLRAEVEVGYRSNNVDGVWSDNIVGTPTTGTVDYDHKSFSVLANVWLDIPIGSGFTPYVGGGLGWADVSAEGAYTCVFGCAAVIPFDFSDDGFAWQAGAGINFGISPNVKLGIGYRYFQGPEPTIVAPLYGLTHDLENGNHSAVATLIFSM